MSQTTFAGIGKELKKRYPGRWPDFTDEEVGKMALASKVPSAFLDEHVERLQKETGYLNAKLEHDEKLIYGQEHMHTHVRQRTELEDAQHQASITNTQITEALQKYVFDEKKTDVPTHSQMLLKSHETTEEIRKTDEIADIEVRKAKEMDINRLAAYEREKSIDVKVAVGLKMVKIEEFIYLVDRIAQLQRQNADFETLQTLETLRDQMAGRLLAKGDGQDVQAINEASDSPAGD